MFNLFRQRELLEKDTIEWLFDVFAWGFEFSQSPGAFNSQHYGYAMPEESPQQPLGGLWRQRIKYYGG